jgi:predicted dehydrogenase
VPADAAGPLRIGISGTGRIADKLAGCARLAPEVQVVAVASRDRRRAHAFAERHGIARAHHGDAALAADTDVDLVYVASLNHLHRRDVVGFLRAGKHVLCEKPFALDAAQAEEMVAVARAEGRFLMDALWSRFLPSWQRAKQLVDDGAIGEVLAASAELGFVTDEGPEGRLLSRALGGGSLYDSGIYPHAFVSWFLGKPTALDARALFGPTGVDEQTVCTFTYASGAHAQVRSSFRAALASAGFLAGTAGSLEVAPRLHRSTQLVLRRLGHDDVVEHLPYSGPGLHFQLAHVARCIAGGRTESPVMPLDETVEILRTLDAIRERIGLDYTGIAPVAGDAPGQAS